LTLGVAVAMFDLALLAVRIHRRPRHAATSLRKPALPPLDRLAVVNGSKDGLSYDSVTPRLLAAC
jgi:hypothetical protein